MKKKTQSPAGYWMLAALCAILALPPIVGHLVMVPQTPAVSSSLHANAAQ